jgi:hypothetical protein
VNNIFGREVVTGGVRPGTLDTPMSLRNTAFAFLFALCACGVSTREPVTVEAELEAGPNGDCSQQYNCRGTYPQGIPTDPQPTTNDCASGFKCPTFQNPAMCPADQMDLFVVKLDCIPN